MESSVFDEIPEEISRHLVSFSEVIDEIDGLISNHFSTEQDANTEPTPLDLIRRDLSLCYTYNALFFVYLRCNGIDANNHPIMQELNRVMSALKRCRSLTEKSNASHSRCDKEAASRFIKHALWQSAHSKTKKRRPNPETPLIPPSN